MRSFFQTRPLLVLIFLDLILAVFFTLPVSSVILLNQKTDISYLGLVVFTSILSVPLVTFIGYLIFNHFLQKYFKTKLSRIAILVVSFLISLLALFSAPISGYLNYVLKTPERNSENNEFKVNFNLNKEEFILVNEINFLPHKYEYHVQIIANSLSPLTFANIKIFLQPLDSDWGFGSEEILTQSTTIKPGTNIIDGQIRLIPGKLKNRLFGDVKFKVKVRQEDKQLSKTFFITSKLSNWDEIYTESVNFEDELAKRYK